MTKFICITTGEPAGIGPEICLDLAYTKYNSQHVLILIGDIKLLNQRANLLTKKVKLIEITQNAIISLNPAKFGELYVLSIHCPNLMCLGQALIENANYVLQTLDTAVDLCLKNLCSLIITAPINKDVINAAGVKFSGHTEYLAAKFKIEQVVMMLANPQLKVALVTTHLALKDVADAISAPRLNQVIHIIHTAFKQYFAKNTPKIAVCGLNPHAGENGYLGMEEIEIINPVIKSWHDQGYQVYGSFPADTIFNYAKEYDLILAMYHDQGLPIVKYPDFTQVVNVTLGLPVLRTSVGHGSALNLAGSGKANSQSLINAVEFALTHT